MTIDTVADRFESGLQDGNINREPGWNGPRDALRTLGEYAERTGLPMLCVDARVGVVVGRSSPDVLPWIPADVEQRLATVTDITLFPHASGLVSFAVPLPDADGARMVGVGIVLSRPGLKPAELVLAAAEENWSQPQLEEWCARLPVCAPALLERLLHLARGRQDGDRQVAACELEIEQLTDQIDRTYEEISLLHSLTQNLQISRSPSELAELCLARLHDLIRPGGSAIWIDEKRGSPQFLVKGRLPFDELGLARLMARYEDHDWSRPLVKNQIEGTLLGADFPGLRNLVVVPIAEGAYRAGWILSCNCPAPREFGTVEASLLNSVATILGTHVRNIDLYQQHHELLLSFVRSLVSTLDAKDPYTRGHSERVALVARRLGEELELPEDDLHDIYLSGLLHDVGKIGVDDRILRKPGQLTDEEFLAIQQHPMIGYEILKGLKNLQKVLPGVRSHHETYNGKGYPDGLKGEEIPLMARILAVADAYDAMGSDRPYRKGMPLEQIEAVFRRGAGDQWDARIIDAYFEARADISRMCRDYSPTEGNLLAEVDDGGPEPHRPPRSLRA